MAVEIYSNYKEMLEKEKMPNGKRKVLETGIQLFSQNGFDGTSTTQIADAAGVSQATIFKYFKTKKELLIAIVAPIIDQLLPSYRDAFFGDLKKQMDLQSLIHFIVYDRFEFISENAAIIKILMTELLTDQSVLPKVIEVMSGLDGKEKSDGVVEVLGSRIIQLKQQGEIYDDLDIVDVGRTIAGQLFSYFFQTEIVLPEVQTEVESDLKKIEAQILRAISPKY